MKRILLLLLIICALLLVAIGWLVSDDCESAPKAYPACSGKFVKQTSNLEEIEPRLGEFSAANEFGVRVRRVTKNAVLDLEDGKARHSYSRRQVWNSNEKLMLIANKVLNSDTLKVVDESIGLTGELNWSNKQPYVMFGLRRNGDLVNEFVQYDVITRESVLVYKFNDHDDCKLGHGEGNVSADDRYAAVVCSASGNRNVLFSLDIEDKAILGTAELLPEYDWASFTATGEFIIVENQFDDNSRRELVRYNSTLTERVQLLDFAEHGDLGLDEFGEDVFVLIDKDIMYGLRIRDGKLAKYVVTGLITSLSKGRWDEERLGYGHVSCRNIKRPGWCYISSSGGLYIGAVKIGFSSASKSSAISAFKTSSIGLNAIEQWGYHHSSSSTYASQPKASVSPSGTKIIFTSDFYGQSEINDYVLTFDED